MHVHRLDPPLPVLNRNYPGSALASLQNKWLLDGVLFTFSRSTQSQDGPLPPTTLGREAASEVHSQKDRLTSALSCLRCKGASTASRKQCRVGQRESMKRIKSAGKQGKIVMGFTVRNLKRLICSLVYIHINKGKGEISGGLIISRNYSEQQQKERRLKPLIKKDNKREHGVNQCHPPYD